MKVVLPMAGFGKRMRPHTYTKPKPLLPVAGNTVLGHVLDKVILLPDLEEVIFIVGWLGDQIEQYVTANYDFPARYVEQRELLGQAHAIALARDYLDGPIIIIFVDTIFETDLREVVNPNVDGVLCVKPVEDPRRFGVAVVEEGRVTRLIEKPKGFEHNLVVVGVYYIKDSQWLLRAIDELMARNIQTKGEYYLADAFQVMVDQGAHFRVHPVEVWEDCGKPEAVLHTNRYLLDHGRDNTAQVQAENSVIIPPVYVHPQAQVVDSIIGPYVHISAGCQVRNAILRDVILDNNVQVEDILLEKSLLGENTVVRGQYQRLNIGDSSTVGVEYDVDKALQ